MDRRTDRPKPICPLNFFEVGGIKTISKSFKMDLNFCDCSRAEQNLSYNRINMVSNIETEYFLPLMPKSRHNFKKFHSSYIIQRIQRLDSKCVDPDEAAHD